MNEHYNQNYTKETISAVLSLIQNCIEQGNYTISMNNNRQENKDFVAEYNLNTKRQKKLLLRIKTKDFFILLRIQIQVMKMKCYMYLFHSINYST